MKRFVRLHKNDSISVCTLGKKCDGTDSVVDTFENAVVKMDYENYKICSASTGYCFAKYPTNEIVFTTTD